MSQQSSSDFPYRTLSSADLHGKRVLVRAGFDVPVDNGIVTDAARIEALVPTMRCILDHGASVILMAHQGRPKDAPDPQFSQRPLVPVLKQLLNATVHFAPSCTGSDTDRMAKALQPGEVLLLENLRFDPREKKNDPVFAKALAGLADVYVNDAFTNCHRDHASMVGVPALLPSYMGIQLETEIRNLLPAVEHPQRPLTLIISGAKMETKIPVLRNFLQKADDIFVGGCIANTFIAARGFDVGTSKYEPDFIEQCQELMLESEKEGYATIHVPRDVVVASEPTDDVPVLDLPLEDISGDMGIYDLGAVSVQRTVDVIAEAAMIVWNGPLGFSEMKNFSRSTARIAEATRDATQRGAVTILGGGDTIDFHHRYGLPLDAYTFVSTGGGAMLEFLGGTPFSSLDVLRL